LDVEFEAKEGVTVLFGASGAGKTLTLDSIAGFARPDSGRILLDDRILFDGEAGISLRPRDRNCGYVFPELRLVSAHDAAGESGFRRRATTSSGASPPRQ